MNQLVRFGECEYIYIVTLIIVSMFPGAVKDSVVGEDRVARYLLSVLNARSAHIRWTPKLAEVIPSFPTVLHVLTLHLWCFTSVNAYCDGCSFIWFLVCNLLVHKVCCLIVDMSNSLRNL